MDTISEIREPSVNGENCLMVKIVKIVYAIVNNFESLEDFEIFTNYAWSTQPTSQP